MVEKITVENEWMKVEEDDSCIIQAFKHLSKKDRQRKEEDQKVKLETSHFS